jgi:hypothetical protein
MVREVREVKVCFCVVVAQVALEEVFLMHVVYSMNKTSAPGKFHQLPFLYIVKETNLLEGSLR